MNIKCLVCVLSFTYLIVPLPTMASWLTHDRAAYATQKGQWDKAKTLLRDALVDKQDNPSLLYDAGVASYKTGDKSQAEAYFKRVTELGPATPALKEQAHFNLGNALVDRKALKEAIEQYEKALSISPNDERAKHNLDIVKRMLAQQQQQQQQQNQQQDKQQQQQQNQQKNNQQQEQQKQQSDKQQQDNQQQDGQSSGQQQGKQEQEKQQSGQQNQESSGQQQGSSEGQKQQKQQGNQHEKGQNEEQRDNEGKKERDGQQDDAGSEQHSETERKVREGAQDPQEQRNGQQQKDTANHDKASGNYNGSGNADQQDKQEDEKAQAMLSEEDKDASNEPTQKLDAWLARLLKEREENDAKVNKRIIKATVTKQMAGEDGQNCW